MNKIFRKAITVLGSAALIGATVGAAAAASYPNPFTSNTAIVVGANAAPSDNIAASTIASDIDAASAGSVGVVTDTSGDIVSLDTSGTRIWLNTSLNTAKATLTKTDLPVVLGDYTFSGNVEAKLTSTLKFDDGNTAGGDNSGKVIFSKQPKSSDDPVVGISMNSSNAGPLYNATVTMKATNFTHADSEGETIHLFGRDFVVSTATDTSDIVLFSSAKELNLVAGGDNPNPSETVVVDGESYDVELITGTSTTATIGVNGDSKEVSEGASKKIGGIDIAVKSATESTALDTVTVTILVGSNKITFTNGATVTQGSEDDPIDGTTAYIVGGTGATTELTVAVFRPDSSNDAILPGQTFVDPVFGSFKVEFAGLNIPLDDTSRDEISIQNSGDKGMTLTMTDSDGNTGTFDFAYNATYAANQVNVPQGAPANWRLADDSNYSIFVAEGANLTEDDYVVLGNEDYGHLLQVTQIYNNTGTDYTTDKLRLQDVISGTSYDSVFTAETIGTLTLDGKTYAVIIKGSGDNGYAHIKYPTGDSSTINTWVVYPTVQTQGGNLVALYEPLNVSLSAWNGTTATSATVVNFPDGDGYTAVTFTYGGNDGNAAQEVWTVSGGSATSAVINASAAADTNNYSVLTIGQFTYNITSSAGVNRTMIYLSNPETDTTSANFTSPSVMIFEKKDDQNKYHGLVVETELAPAGTSASGVGVNDVLFTQDGEYYHASATLASDSDITKDIDWYGALVTTDADDSDQKTVTITLPSEQVFAQIYIGESSATVTGSDSEAGVMTFTDSESASFAGKNLVVVGGSCINSIAAELLGVAACEDAFASKTGVNAGEFLIQSFDRSGKTALLVAGYNAADTTKAATYLVNNAVTTDTGTKYKGTSATEASLVVA